jgi:hypothetical protein
MGTTKPGTTLSVPGPATIRVSDIHLLKAVGTANDPQVAEAIRRQTVVGDADSPRLRIRR